MPLKRGYSRKTFDENVIEMIGAGHSRASALAASFKSARDSYFKAHPQGALPLWMVPKSGKRLKNQQERAQNPVPASKKVQLRNASKLYEDFTGHDADEYELVDKPVIPDVMLLVGDIDFIGYTTVRDGKTEKYIHRFKKNCRPHFTVSHDGKQLFMLGGSYDFTELGIVDKT